MKTYRIRAKVRAETLSEGRAADITHGVKSIHISKQLGVPSGTWELEMLPVRDDKDGVSWYHRLAPMDYVEIGFTREPGGEIPIVMRGFVDQVSMSVSVDQNGRPNRTYRVRGRDYGKILEIAQIYYLMVVDSDLQLIGLPAYQKIYEKWQVRLASNTPAAVLEDLLGIAQTQLGLVQSTYTAPDLSFLGSTNVVGKIHSFALTQEDGSVWDFMQYFANTPWNELFLVDRAVGPTLVFRKTPWKANGVLVQGEDSTYEALKTKTPVTVGADDVISASLSRSDTEVKNYYMTYPTQCLLGSDTSFKQYVLQGKSSVAELTGNPLVDMTSAARGVNRFGFRKFENRTEYIVLNDKNNLGEAAALAEQLNLYLARAFEQNGDFESGSLTLKGNHAVQIGKFLKLDTPGLSVKPEYYISGVDHELTLVTGQERFTTTASVVRGTGYIETKKRLANAMDLGQRRVISGRF